MSQAYDDSSEILEALRSARLVARRTQEDVAAVAGIDQAVISKLERGARRCSLDQACRIAGALGFAITVTPRFTSSPRLPEAVAS